MKKYIKGYLFLVFFSVPTFADNKIPPKEQLPSFDEISQAIKKEPKTNFLYISKIEDVKNVETMTYYLDKSSDLKDNLFDSFYSFAERIDLSNGAVYLPTLKGKWNKNRNTNFEYFDKSNCKDKKIFLGNTFIVFEIRKSGMCLAIPITEKQYLEPVLAVISKNVKDYKKLKDVSNYLKVKSAMEKDLKELGVPVENLTLLETIVDYIKSVFK